MALSRNLKKGVSSLAIFALVFAEVAAEASSVCKNPTGMLNPVTDVVWAGVLPIKSGGITTMSGPRVNDLPDAADSATCICPMPVPPYTRIGLTYGMWEPFIITEVVAKAWCMPMLDQDMQPGSGWPCGSTKADKRSQRDLSSSYDFHYITFPVWAMMGTMVDSMCTESGGMTVAMMSEVCRQCKDDKLAVALAPESIPLSAAPIQFVSSFINSILCFTGINNSLLFWQICGAGSTYPMTGNTTNEKEAEATMTIAAKSLFLMGRLMMVCDPAIWYCFCVQTPIVVWSNYRIHVSKPIPDFEVHPLGDNDLKWGMGKVVPWSGDNFAYTLFRKRTCCVM